MSGGAIALALAREGMAAHPPEVAALWTKRHED